MKKPVGILGGSFDPIHFGHLRLALECLQQIDLEKVTLIPLNSPRHRPPLQATAQQRHHMLELATMNIPNLETSNIEIMKGGTTYTIDTLEQLRKKLGNQSICLILGMDAFQKFFDWERWQEILNFTHLIVASRAGLPEKFSKSDLRSFYEAKLATDIKEAHAATNGRIFKVNIPFLNISSSLIRNHLHGERSARFLLPDDVLKFIHDEQVYTTKHNA